MEPWEQRQKLLDRLEELSNLDTLDDEQRAEWDTTEAEIKRLDETVARKRKLDELALKTPTFERKSAEVAEQHEQREKAETATEKLPAVPRWCPGRLTAFRGDDGRNDVDAAYRTGQFYAATLFGNPYSKRWCQEHGIEIRQGPADAEDRVMTGNVNTAGGFLVPTETEASIIRLVEERGVFRRNADIVPMASDTKDHPKRNSGLTLYYPGEAGTITLSDVGYTNVKLVARKAATLTKVSSELSEDSIVSVADSITTEIAYAMADGEDEAGFNGDGTSTYGSQTGLANALNSGSIKETASGSLAFADVTLAEFEAAVSQLKVVAGMDVAWYISSTGYWLSMANLANAGGGTTAETLAAGPGQRMFMGFPVRFAQVLTKATGDTASTVLCYVGDLRMSAVMGVRRGVTVATSSDVYFADDSIGIRGTERFHIVIHETGTSTVGTGTIVALKTPAS